MAAVAWFHGLVFRLAAMLLGQILRLVVFLFVTTPIAAATRLFTTVWAWMNLMWRVWTSIFVTGFLVLVIAQAMVKLSPPGHWVRMVALLMVLFWLVSFFSAAAYSLRYLNFARVRDRALVIGTYQGVQELVKRPRELTAKAANAAQGTPLESAFKVNRARRDRAEAAEQQAADDQAARDQQIEEWNREHNPYGDEESA